MEDFELENCKKEIMVSICCATYNHEPYIRTTLDSFLSQKTNFPYEIIVNDDASNDGTSCILKKYEEQYPNIIRVIYQNENQYSKHKKIFTDILLPMARGKYIAICEGDDYWMNDEKLQMQFDVMEKNANCSMCVHKTHDINEMGVLLSNIYPPIDLTEGIVKSYNWMKMMFCPERYLFHTSSFFLRRESMDDLLENRPEFLEKSGVGDVPLTWYMALKGDLFYIEKEMSYYRRDTLGSWSCMMQKRNYRRKMAKSAVESIYAFKKYIGNEYYPLIESAILKREFDYFRLSDNFPKMINKKYKDYFSKLSALQRVISVLRWVSSIK